MSETENHSRIIKKHVDFWTLAEVKEPLVGKLPFAGWQQKPYPLSNGREIINPALITAGDIDIDRLLGLDGKLRQPFGDNIINCIGPIYSESWMEALIGCPVYASAYSCTAKPVLSDIHASPVDFDMEKILQSDWLKIMDALLRRAVTISNAGIAVRQLHLRGVIDMLAAYMGDENLCLAFYDQPELLEALADKFADLYITIASRGLRIRPQWNGGFVSGWATFAPGPLVDYQIDASNLLSTQLYEKYILKYDKKILKEFCMRNIF